jgi:hypothetical protein
VQHPAHGDIGNQNTATGLIALSQPLPKPVVHTPTETKVVEGVAAPGDGGNSIPAPTPFLTTVEKRGIIRLTYLSRSQAAAENGCNGHQPVPSGGDRPPALQDLGRGRDCPPQILCTGRRLHHAFGIGAALFIATHDYARKEHATGFLVPTEGIARITPPRSGTITAVHLSEGQHVERGAPLLTLTDAATSDRGEDIDDAKAAWLHEQHDHVKDQVRLERQKAEAEEQRPLLRNPRPAANRLTATPSAAPCR